MKKWPTRHDARTEMATRPRVYTKGLLIAMHAELQRRAGMVTVYTAHPIERWNREEILTWVLDLMFMCQECSGTQAHTATCTHYEPCERDHHPTLPCGQCKKPNADPAPARLAPIPYVPDPDPAPGQHSIPHSIAPEDLYPPNARPTSAAERVGG